jgi:hypothetical protein
MREVRVFRYGWKRVAVLLIACVAVLVFLAYIALKQKEPWIWALAALWLAAHIQLILVTPYRLDVSSETITAAWVSGRRQSWPRNDLRIRDAERYRTKLISNEPQEVVDNAGRKASTISLTCSHLVFALVRKPVMISRGGTGIYFDSAQQLAAPDAGGSVVVEAAWRQAGAGELSAVRRLTPPMKADWISFELSQDGEELDIHGSPAALRRLAAVLERLASLPKSDHEHLWTSEWAGDDLASESQGGGRVLNKVTVHSWQE